MANLDLFEWQVGIQSDFDTAVAATKKLSGITGGKITPGVEVTPSEEQSGSLFPAYNVTVDKVTGAATVEGDATFEHINYFLESLLGAATPTGAGPYVRTHVGPGSSVPASRLLSLFHGDSTQGYKLVGGVANEFTLKVESNARATFTAGLIGHSVEEDTAEALSDDTVNLIHANQAAIKIDAWGGTMGATAFTPDVYSIELGLNLAKALKMGIGSANPTGTKIRRTDGGSNQLKMGLEYTGATKTYMASILAAASGGPLKLQVEIGFTLDADHILTVQFAGYAPEAPEAFNDTDGTAQLDLVLSPMYHATFGNWLKIISTNQVQDITA